MSKLLSQAWPAVSHHNCAQNSTKREADLKNLTSLCLKLEFHIRVHLGRRAGCHAAAHHYHWQPCSLRHWNCRFHFLSNSPELPGGRTTLSINIFGNSASDPKQKTVSVRLRRSVIPIAYFDRSFRRFNSSVSSSVTSARDRPSFVNRPVSG